jgi:hypothetical protein
VEGCAAKIQHDEQPKPAGSPQRSSLLNFFRPNQRRNSDAELVGEPKSKESEANARHELVGQLPPAKCFRAELFRTLTCRSCGYSRKQVETFYDFSLDLPFMGSAPAPTSPPRSHDEPSPEPLGSLAVDSERKCFCGEVATVIDKETERVYSCPNSACSFVDKVTCNKSAESEDGPAVVTPPSSQQQEGSVATIQLSPTTNARVSLDLETLIRKQFQPETLELTCEKCKVGKEVELAYAVKSLPPLVALHLKRFEVDHSTGALFKRCDPVLAPPTLDFVRGINNLDTSSPDNTQYTLKVRPLDSICGDESKKLTCASMFSERRPPLRPDDR